MPRGHHDHLFKKGQSGNPAGKPKGAKDKIIYNVGKICQEAGFDPVSKLIELAKNGRSERVQLEASYELLGYIAPKLKAIELSGNDAVEKFQLIMNLSAQSSENVKNINVHGHSNGE